MEFSKQLKVNMINLDQTQQVQKAYMEDIVQRRDEMLEKVKKANEVKRHTEDEKEKRDNYTVELLEQIAGKPNGNFYAGVMYNNNANGTMQNIHDKVYGTLNVSTEIGLSAEEFKILLTEMEELFSLGDKHLYQETSEIIDQLKSEVGSNQPKKGVLKASVIYLIDIAKKFIVNPLVLGAKEQFHQFAQEKATIIISKLEKMLSFFQ